MSSAATQVFAPALSPEVSDSIREEAFAGLKALPRRGAEIGGFLTNSTENQLTADGLQLVFCEHLFGPSYRLSSNDLETLRQRASGAAVIAYFRSCTNDAFSVTLHDDEAIAAALPQVGFALLVKPFLTGKATARWYSRVVSGQWSLVREWTLDPPGFSIARPTQDAPPVAALVANSAVASASHANHLGWAFGSLGGLALGAAATWFVLHQPQQPVRVQAYIPVPAYTERAAPQPAPERAQPQPADFGLHTNSEGGVLRLSWNNNQPDIKSAALGSLDISDGAQTHLVLLQPRQLAQGWLSYNPRSQNVSFRLSIEGTGSAPHFQAVQAAGIAPANAKAAKPAPAMLNAQPQPVHAEVATPQPALPVMAQKTLPEPVPMESHPLPSVSPQNVSSEPQAILNVRPPAMIAPPQVAEFTGPKPLQRSRPDLSSVPPSLMAVVSDVRIQVRVNEQGRVIQVVELTSQPDNKFLTRLALNAARRWTFEPARRQGQPVPSDYTIAFHFGPAS